MFNFSKFFLEKIYFLAKKNVDIFENSIYFLILCIVLKNETSLPSLERSPRTPCMGRLIAFNWRGVPSRKNSRRGHCKFLNQIIEFTENFSGCIGFIKIENFQIIIRKNQKFLSNMFNFSKFFLRKRNFSGKKMLLLLKNGFISKYFESF